MPFTDLLMQYGYPALFIGCLLEGETLLLLAGFAAHQGYLSFPLVLLVAFAGGTLGDQLFFQLGRRIGPGILQHCPGSAQRIEQVHRLLARHQRWLIVSIRFLYGLRIAGPVVMGSCKIPTGVFMAFNMLGALLWAVTVASLGYLFGRTGAWLFAGWKQNEAAALLVLAAAGLTVWLVRRLRQKKR